MNTVRHLIVPIGILYCALGNAAAYLIVSRKGLSPSFFWSGTPFYVYLVCRRSPGKISKSVTYLALSSSLAGVAVLALAAYWLK
jgi:hypothetical protein